MFVDPTLKEEGQNPKRFRLLVNTLNKATATNVVINCIGNGRV